MSTQLSLEQVAQVARLGRLDLSEEYKERIRTDLNAILKEFARLQELDTTDVPPTSHAIRQQNVFRDDIVCESLSQERATRNAPDKRNGNFIVPQIVGG